MSTNNYFLDLSDEGNWLIKSVFKHRFVAGTDKGKVIELIFRLNDAHRPNVEQRNGNEVWVCWNEHERSEGCDYKREI